MNTNKTRKVANRKVETIAVLVPTYARPDALQRCLAALQLQSLRLNEVLIIVRNTDRETQDCISKYFPSTLPIRIVLVDRPGAIAARNAGIEVCESDILAMIDDDTTPHVDWAKKILEDFARDSHLGGLGGRDRCFADGRFDERRKPVVGKIQWFGNVIGNHHLGFGQIREVDALKGANMSFRMEALAKVRFDSRLKGTGAQPGEDVCFTVAVKNEGWTIAYDPAVLVDHYPAVRGDQRFYAEVSAVKNTQKYWEFSYNQVVMIWDALTPWKRVALFGWSSLVGNRNFPGIVQAVRFTPQLGAQSWRRFLIAQRAKLRAFADLLLAKQ